jgi:hypothetical protein
MRGDGVAEIQELLVGGTHFDDFVDGKLIDYKDHKRYLEFLDESGNFKPWFRGGKELRDEAIRQVKAANGMPIEWRVGDARLINAMKRLLHDIPGITVAL